MATSASVEVVYRGIFQKTSSELASAWRGAGLAHGGQGRHRLCAVRRLARAQRHPGQELRRRRHRPGRAREEPGQVRAVSGRRLGLSSTTHVQGHRVLGLVRHPADQQARSAGRLADRHLGPLGRRADESTSTSSRTAGTLAIIPSHVHAGVFAPEGTASFAGLWVYNDDNTDYQLPGGGRAVDAAESLTIEAVEQDRQRER